jgi:hypothetical protein
MQVALMPKEFYELKPVQRKVSGSDYIKVTGILMLHKGFLQNKRLVQRGGQELF